VKGLVAAVVLAGFLVTGCHRTNPLESSASAASPTAEETAEKGPAFLFPTANRELLKSGGETNFFTPTGPGRPWTGGAFGCVRNSGGRMHEGIDIFCQKRDAKGEPIDKVRASRAGTVVHVSGNVAASNYGKYVVLRHELDGLPVYSLYAHLRSIEEGLAVGDELAAADLIGVLGRTANTREGIVKARAHLHFEIGVWANSNFNGWFDRWYKDGKNLHGNWNGLNLLGLDAAEILRQADAGRFKLLDHLKSQPVICRVRVHQTKLDWVERFPQLLADEGEGKISAWDLDLNFNGVPVRMQPVRGEVKTGGAKYALLEVDAKVRAKYPCSGLVFRKGSRWVFTSKGNRAMDLLLFQ